MGMGVDLRQRAAGAGEDQLCAIESARPRRIAATTMLALMVAIALLM